MITAMFANHQPIIAAYGAKSPENFARVVMFSVLSIRQPFNRLTDDMQSPETIKAALFGHKWQAYDFVTKHADDLWRLTKEIDSYRRQSPQSPYWLDYLVDQFLAVPGIGIVKAGFCTQLLFGVSGCLDTHNTQRLGISEDVLRSDRYKGVGRPLRAVRIRKYNLLIDALGGAERLWNEWCTYVANLYAATPEEISRRHVDAICKGEANG